MKASNALYPHLMAPKAVRPDRSLEIFGADQGSGPGLGISRPDATTVRPAHVIAAKTCIVSAELRVSRRWIISKGRICVQNAMF